jgi:Tol biopolymer transport system component
VLDIKGQGLSRLTNNGDDYSNGPHDFHPSWSPQGDAIAFERDTPDFSSSGIFIMKPDGGGSAKVLTLSPPARANRLQRLHGQKLDSRSARRLKQIEDGGALPQWGPATH